MRISAVIVLVLFVAQQHSRSIYLAYFLLNRDAIAKEKCINLDKPEMRCDGKCHLKKTLREATPEVESRQENNTRNELPSLRIKDISLYFSVFTALFTGYFRHISCPAAEVPRITGSIIPVPTPPPQH